MKNKIKQWVLNLKWVREDREQLYMKAFNSARRDLEETVLDNTDKLADQKLMNLLSVVDYNKVIKVDKSKGIVFIGEERADPGTLANLKSEAEFLMQSEIWKLLQETPKELAQQALFKVSESIDDLKKGKAILYTLNAQQNIIDILRSYINK